MEFEEWVSQAQKKILETSEEQFYNHMLPGFLMAEGTPSAKSHRQMTVESK